LESRRIYWGVEVFGIQLITQANVGAIIGGFVIAIICLPALLTVVWFHLPAGASDGCLVF
jgi:hypothetical protein